MRCILLFALAIILAGCEFTPQTPLGHALAALRAGDRDAFLKAKVDAGAALQKAWRPGDDPCNVTAGDLEIRGEASLIDKLDHADLFKLGDEMRFVYAAHVVGKYDAPMGAAWADNAFDSVFRPGFSDMGHGFPKCNGEQQAMMQMASAGLPPSELDRVGVMQGWQDEIRGRYGDDAEFQDHLRRASASLHNNGFTAEYPVTLEFTDSDRAAPETFGDVQKKLGN